MSPLHEELSQLLDCCEVCFKNETGKLCYIMDLIVEDIYSNKVLVFGTEMESVMNSILSLVLIVTEQRDQLIRKCCDKLSATMSSDDPTAPARLRM